MGNKKIFFIYWANKDFAIVKNIVDVFSNKGYKVDEFCVQHFQQTNLGRKINLKSNNNIFNFLYLSLIFIWLNVKSLFRRKIFVLGPNTIYFIFFRIMISRKKSFFVHYNELPSFIENKKKGFKEKLDSYIFNKIKYIIVSNKFRKKLFKKHEKKKHKYFILENILRIKTNNMPTKELNFNNNRLKLLYVGIINSNRMIKELLELVVINDFFELIIAGKLDKDSQNLIKIFDKNKDRITYKGNLLHKEVLSLIKNNCDLGMAFYDLNSLNNYYCAPLKIHEYFYYNKLVISLKNPSLVEIENKFKIIYSINHIKDLFREETIHDIKNRISTIKVDDFVEFRNLANSSFIKEMNKIITYY